MSRSRFPTFRRAASRLVDIAPKLLVALLALAVIAGGVWTYYNIKWGGELDRELKQWQQQGLPLTMAEVIPEKIPDAENAAPIYLQVFNVSFDPGKQPESMRNLAGLTEAEETLVEEYLSGEDRTKAGRVKAILSQPEVKQTLQVLRLASQRKKSVFPVKWEQGFGALFPHLARFRQGVRLVAANALILAAGGQVDEALDWCVVGLRMASHVESEPTLIAQLVTMAMRHGILDALEEIIAPRSVPAKAGRHLREELQRIDVCEAWVDALKSEAAIGRQMFAQLPGRPKLLADLTPGEQSWVTRIGWAYCGWPGGPLRKHDETTYLYVMRRQIEAATKPWPDAKATFDAIERQIQQKTLGTHLIAGLTPVFAEAARKKDIANARVDLGRIALMLKAHKQQHGQYPASLGELAQSPNVQLPTDPFTGAAYIYARQGHGFVAYSLGPDGDDDGGVEAEKRNAADADGDIAWRGTR